jgi:hypothetical protein
MESTNKPALRIPNKVAKQNKPVNPFKDQDVARAVREYEAQQQRTNFHM